MIFIRIGEKENIKACRMNKQPALKLQISLKMKSVHIFNMYFKDLLE
jgi:hypothetical protein